MLLMFTTFIYLKENNTFSCNRLQQVLVSDACHPIVTSAKCLLDLHDTHQLKPLYCFEMEGE